MGAKAIFIRVVGCDLHCEWCDTKYAWDTTDASMMSPETIVDRVEYISDSSPLVVITGGNPFLYEEIGEVISELDAQRYFVMAETQGTIYQPWAKALNLLTISPKPDHYHPGVIEVLCKDVTTVLKIVCFNDDDIEFAKAVNEAFSDVPMILQVGNRCITAFTHHDHLLRRLEWLITEGHKAIPKARVLPQLHILLWGNKRGV